MATRLDCASAAERATWHHVRTRISMRRPPDYEPDENDKLRVEFFDWILSQEAVGFFAWLHQYDFYFSDPNTAFEVKMRWG